MVDLFGKKISDQKPIQYSLNKLFGISNHSINLMCKQLGLNPSIKLKNLNYIQIRKLQKFIEDNFIFEQVLKTQLSLQREKLNAIKLRRSIRFLRGFPIRGQRTRSNSSSLKRRNKQLQKKTKKIKQQKIKKKK